jgi:hypothetical protein
MGNNLTRIAFKEILNVYCLYSNNCASGRLLNISNKITNNTR